MSDVRQQRLRAAAIVLAAVGTLLLPYFVVGAPQGDDSAFYFGAWAEYAQAWREGTLWPMWAERANHNLGEPRLLFYPPLAPMIGGVLWTLLPLPAAYYVFVALAAVVAGALMYRLARLFLDREGSALAAALYVVAPYTIADAYLRSALPELLALAWLPLAAEGLCRIARDDFRTGIRVLALGFGAVALTNIPAAIVTGYACAAAVAGWTLRLRWRPAAAGAIGAVAGLALASPHLLAVATEIEGISTGHLLRHDFAQNFLFSEAAQLSAVHLGMTIAAITLSLGVAASLFLLRKHGRPEMTLAIFAALGLVLPLPLSAFLWETLPRLRFVQFPWRWLMLANVVYAVWMARAASVTGGRRRRMILFLAVAFCAGSWYHPIVRTLAEPAEFPELAAEIAGGLPGYSEYSPPGSAPARADHNLSHVTATPPAEQVAIERWTGAEKRFRVRLRERSRLLLGVTAYRGWRAQCNGQPVPMNGPHLFSFELPPGEYTCELRLPWPRGRWIGLGIALVAAAALLAWPAGRARR